MEGEPLAAVDERISKDGRHDLGDVAPFLTKTSFLKGRSGGSAKIPKVVELVFGSSSTRRAEKLSPCIAWTAVAVPSVRSRVFVFAGPSASMARRGCRASCSWLANCCSKSLIISSTCLSYFSFTILHSYSHVGWPDPNYWGTGPSHSGIALLSFRSMLGKPQYRGH